MLYPLSLFGPRGPGTFPVALNDCELHAFLEIFVYDPVSQRPFLIPVGPGFVLQHLVCFSSESYHRKFIHVITAWVFFVLCILNKGVRSIKGFGNSLSGAIICIVFAYKQSRLLSFAYRFQ